MKMFTLTTKLILLSICIASIQAYAFSYTFADRLLTAKIRIKEKFETIADTYRNMYTNLNKYSNELKMLLETSHNYDDAGEFVSNPIYAFKLIKLLLIDYQNLKNLFTGKHTTEFIQVMEEAILSHNLSFPTVRDLMGVCHAIIRLQDVYNLDEKNIIMGNFQNYWNGSLTLDDLEELQNCYKYHKDFRVDEWASSNVINDENDDVKFLLREYYYVLRAFYETTKLTTSKILRQIPPKQLSDRKAK